MKAVLEGDKLMKEVLNGGYNVHPVPRVIKSRSQRDDFQRKKLEVKTCHKLSFKHFCVGFLCLRLDFLNFIFILEEISVWRLVFWNSIHLEVASDSFCFLLYSSWLIVFILYVFEHYFSFINLYCWKGLHFSRNRLLSVQFFHFLFPQKM